MFRFPILTIVVALILSAVAPVGFASAASMISSGCMISNYDGEIAGAGVTIEDEFYVGEMLTLSSRTPFAFRVDIANSDQYRRPGLHKVEFRFPFSGRFKLQIIPATGQPMRLSSSCKKNPISDGCLISNQKGVVSPGSPLVLLLDYNRGERLHISANANLAVTVQASNSGHITSYQGITADHTFTQSNNYRIEISIKSAPANFSITCTDPATADKVRR